MMHPKAIGLISSSHHPLSFTYLEVIVMFNQILFPVDNSRETGHAIPLVADLAQRYSGTVLLLSVFDPSLVESEQSQSAKETIAALLHHTESTLYQAGVTSIKTEYREGKIPFVICDVADEMEMDLIVMGCRGLGLTDEGHDDSVSNRVINLAPCPVLVVP